METSTNRPTLFDAIRAEGYTPVIHAYPHRHPDALGTPDPSAMVAACSGGVIALASNCWGWAYSAAHEICELRMGFKHSEMLFIEQANLMSRWITSLTTGWETDEDD